MQTIKLQLKGIGPVVIIDDSKTTLELLKVYYKSSRLKNPLLTFLGGEAFFHHLEKVKDGEHDVPELVFVDINMPGMDGFEVLEKLRSNDEFKKIPICAMLTSSDHQADKDRAAVLGVHDFIVKPDHGTEYIEIFNALAA